MKILVLSDSHSGLGYMRRCIRAVRPEAVVHLGDYFEDGKTMAEENPGLPFYQVPGNCDRYRFQTLAQEVLSCRVDGVSLFLTHGHLHGVKSGLGALLRDAWESGAAAVLFGHTHAGLCRREPDGLWVLNPGTCCTSGGTVGLMETARGQITACRLLSREDIERLEGLTD